MIKIVADSTCNLPPDVLRRHDIRVAPISIQFGNETFEEGISIDRPTFYQKIEELGIIPTTAQPTPAWFAEHYREFHQAGHSVLVITITSKHSGTYESALLGSSLIPEASVEVFDSLSISLGTGYMLLEAARGAEAGWGMDQIVARLGEIRSRMRLFLTPSTLKYLQMSGRVGALRFALGSLLDLKPVIALDDGQLEAIENVRTRSKALTRMLDLMEDRVGTSEPVNLAVVHAQAEEEGKELLDRARARFKCNEVLFHDLVASLAVHGGPGVLGLIAYPV